jgi:catechol 2,3-dioxygenase-like lactoylglutathione lyase family enzyme
MKLFANTLIISDLEKSKDFYSSVFQKSPVFEDENSVVYSFGDVVINLLIEREAPELIAPAKVASGESGFRIQMTVQVEDVDAEVTRIRALGIDLVNGPLDRSWGIRTALLADPDGHLWEFAQSLAK